MKKINNFWFTYEATWEGWLIVRYTNVVVNANRENGAERVFIN